MPTPTNNLPLPLIALLVLTLLPQTAHTTTTSSKRGLCHVPSDNHPSDDKIWTSPQSPLTWYYNYEPNPSPSFTSHPTLQFVPMLWGATDADLNSTTFLDTIKSQILSGQNVSYVLGFNEPDGPHSTGGSSIPADLAAAVWKKQIEPLKELGVRVGAPAVTGSPGGFTWLENFFKECGGMGDKGCNPDFMPVHWYGGFEGLASHVGQVMGTYPGLEVWVTEWGLAGEGLERTQGNFNVSVEWFDRMENITHYSYFGAFRSDVSNVGPNAAMLTEKGELTDIGSWYLGGAATNNVPTGEGGVRIAKFAGWGLVVLGTVVWTLL